MPAILFFHPGLSAKRSLYWSNLGFLSDIFKRRKIVMIISSALGLIAILIILYQSNKQLLQIGFFILGLGAAGQSVGFAIVGEQFKKQSIAVGLGLVPPYQMGRIYRDGLGWANQRLAREADNADPSAEFVRWPA